MANEIGLAPHDSTSSSLFSCRVMSVSSEAPAKAFRQYEIGVPGQAWGDAERQEWRSRQAKKRSYNEDVRAALHTLVQSNEALKQSAEVVEYGHIDYSSLFGGADSSYTLVGVKSKEWQSGRPVALVTGGVHGYETSGVHGALLFIKENLVSLTNEGVNVLVLPCISPWAYETINRWNPEAVDPNRSFNRAKPGCQEAGLAMAFIESLTEKSSLPSGRSAPAVLVHTDLHETTDTDNSEFTPAKIARNGSDPEPWSEIPDGFYLVGDSDRPTQPLFHAAMLDAVRQVTHIAPADENGAIIGVPITAPGLVDIPCESLFLCAAQTAAPFVVTTEVYPDSPKTSPDECNRAQVACALAGIRYALQQGTK